MIRIAVFLLLFISTASFSKTLFRPPSFSIVFGACFKNDIVTLKINNVPVITKYEVISNKTIIGASNLTLSQFEKSLDISFNGITIYKDAIPSSQIMVLEFIVNDIPYHFSTNLKKGNVYIVGFCEKSPSNDRVLILEQRKIKKQRKMAF